MVNNTIKFILKVIRNSFILSGLYFLSVWAAGDLSWIICKPIIIFFLGYIFAELANFYGLQNNAIPQISSEIKTLIF